MDARKRPLLVLYYPPASSITEDDLEAAYRALRTGATPDAKIPELDVLIESYGGNPVAGYRLAQVVRGFTERLFVLVAEHAYSAATLFTFAADELRLAHYAGLSPIDITLVSAPGDRPPSEVELATIDSVLDFATDARRRIEKLLMELNSERSTNVDSDILVEMLRQADALQVGKYYRERLLTGTYAKELLGSYMFRERLDRDDCIRRVYKNFLLGAPGHNFHLDLALAQKWGVAATGMPTYESDLAKEVVGTLADLAMLGEICPSIGHGEKLAFIAFYPLAQTVQPTKEQPSESTDEEREGDRHEAHAY